jgi:SAM-dependent methyltransferase
MSFPEYVERNVANWTRTNAEFTNAAADGQWAREEITWGIWGIPEAELDVLGDVSGLDVVELGCGTAYISAWLMRAGARPVGVDPTPAQLETARRKQAETGLEFPLVEGVGERVPLSDASFDLAVSEYGASIWADPYRWIPEASRLLRPGGRLVFLCNSTLVVLCLPDVGVARTELQRPQFGMYRFDWPDSDGGGIEFHLAHGEWIELLRANGLDVERLLELQAPEDAEDPGYYSYVTAEWGRQWPCEEIWVARKR